LESHKLSFNVNESPATITITVTVNATVAIIVIVTPTIASLLGWQRPDHRWIRRQVAKERTPAHRAWHVAATSATRNLKPDFLSK
jgi:hypothetical protein